MGIEIERKFLVDGDRWRAAIERTQRLDQGYIRSEDATVRVRTIDDAGFITLKGKTTNVSRSEFEYEIPLADAVAMLDEFCGACRLTKRRHTVTVGDHEWVIDEFDGQHEGLVMAEIELEGEDEEFERPEWAGSEVSHDPRFYNSNLCRSSETPREAEG